MKEKRRIMHSTLPNAQENIVDRFIGYFAPERAVRRRYARTVLAATEGYKGASRSRRGLSDFKASTGSADYIVNNDLPILRERSRDLVRNNPLAGGAINTTVNSVVGTGLRLNARIDRDVLGMTKEEARAFENEAEYAFRVWCDECDIERALSFYDIQELVFRSTLENGDVLVLLPHYPRAGDAFGLKLQVVEGDRLCNPHSQPDSEYLSSGVKLDATGAAVAYWIMTQHPGDLKVGYRREWQEYAALSESGRVNVLHLFRKLRAGQHRGIPYLAPVIEPLKQLDRYTDAEIMAAVIAGMFTVFIESDSPDGFSDMMPTDDAAGSGSSEEYKLNYGAMVDLNPGEKITTANPGRPNAQFDPFVTSVYRQIGVALELPYEVLIKHFTSSYSAARAAILEAWRFFHARRAWLVRGLCTPVYRTWMTEAVARGYLNAPGFLEDPFVRHAYLGAEWIGPTQGQIDPVKEVQAAEKRLALKLTTRSEECAAITGTDWDRKVPQILDEEELVGAVKLSGQTSGTGSNGNTDENDDENDNEGDEQQGTTRRPS